MTRTGALTSHDMAHLIKTWMAKYDRKGLKNMTKRSEKYVRIGLL